MDETTLPVEGIEPETVEEVTTVSDEVQPEVVAEEIAEETVAE